MVVTYEQLDRWKKKQAAAPQEVDPVDEVRELCTRTAMTFAEGTDERSKALLTLADEILLILDRK